MNEDNLECKVMNMILENKDIIKIILFLGEKIKSKDCDGLRDKIKKEYSFYIKDEDIIKINYTFSKIKKLLELNEKSKYEIKGIEEVNREEEKIEGKIIPIIFEF